MKKVYQTAAIKRPYLSPQLLAIALSSFEMLAASGDAPEVHTTTDKASTEHEALTKESKNIWDEDW